MTISVRIEDRLALQDLIAAYSWALDTGDVEGLVACFTPDTRMAVHRLVRRRRRSL